MSCNLDADLDPRVRRTRKLLQDALRSLLREKRFANLSVAEIAARATINRNTFYAHYDDKFALLESVLRTDLSALVFNGFPERPAFTRANFTIFAAIVIGFLGDLEATSPRVGGEAERLIHSAIQEDIRQWIDGWLPEEAANALNGFEHPVRPGSRETAVTVISWSLFGCAHRWSRGKRERPPEALAEELAAMLLPPRGPLAAVLKG
jgi:AcrR family transcriptional regulator